MYSLFTTCWIFYLKNIPLRHIIQLKIVSSEQNISCWMPDCRSSSVWLLLYTSSNMPHKQKNHTRIMIHFFWDYIFTLMLHTFWHDVCYNCEHKSKVQPKTCHECIEGEKYSSGLSLTSALDAGGWLTPCRSHFTPQEWTGTQCVRVWAGTKPSLDGCRKSYSTENISPDCAFCSLSPYRLHYPRPCATTVWRWITYYALYIECFW